MTKLDPITQLAGVAAGEPELFVKLASGALAFVRLDPETLELVAGTPPVLRALIPAEPPPAGGTELSWLREGIVVSTASQVWTLAQPVAPAGLLLVFRNGLLMLEGPDYSYLNGVVTFAPGQPISVGDTVQFTYQLVG